MSEVLYSSGDIARFSSVVFVPGCTYELRCPKAGKRKTISGYFTDSKKFGYYCELWSGGVPAVYATLNPVLPDLMARNPNQAEPYPEHTTGDAEIVHRYPRLIDGDPVRLCGRSSTHEEP